MTNQLTLDKNSNYRNYQEVISIVKKGKFEEALKICKKMVDDKVVFDDLFNTIKSLQFWVDRQNKYYSKINNVDEKENIENLKKYWEDYKWHLSEYNFFQKNIFFALREAVYNEIIKNNFLLLDKTKEDKIEQKKIFLETGKYLLKIKEVKDSHSLLNKSLALDSSCYNAERNLLFSNIFALQGKDQESILWLKKSFVFKERIDYKEIYNPLIIESVAEMRQQNFLETEIEIWLPIHLYLSGVFYQSPLILDSKQLKESKILEILSQKEQQHQNDDYFLTSSIIYYYLLLIEIFHHQRNEAQLKKYFHRLKKISNFIYQKTKNSYIQ